jgi:hypothetical protein
MFILDEFRKVVPYPGGKIARIDNTLSMISSRYPFIKCFIEYGLPVFP